MKRVATAIGCLLLAGCPFAIPNPDPHHGADVISPEVQGELHPGTSTRTDVLLLLGNPRHRLEDDRFFIYAWSEVHALVGVLVLPFGTPLAGEVGDEHRLALEFRRDGVLRRMQIFRATLEFDDKDQAALDGWMKAQGPAE